MSKINFDEMDISWHYWAYNVLTGWAYKNGKKSGLGPFFARADSKVGHYIYTCGEENGFYAMVYSMTNDFIITYTWCDGHGTVCDSILLHKSELEKGKIFLENILWHLVCKSGNFFKEAS